MATASTVTGAPDCTHARALSSARVSLSRVKHHAASCLRAARAGSTSSNWSGYALTAKPYSSMSGTWTVPAVTATPANAFSAMWIGIDGYSNAQLIQVGTNQFSFNNHSYYSAWWEILPDVETIIPSMKVHAGDHMSAAVSKQRGTTWTISLSNLTTGKKFSTTKTYNGPGSSAEFIQEALTVGNGIATLPQYDTTGFDLALVNGARADFNQADSVAMVQGGVQVSTSSPPGDAGDAFDVAYGPDPPAAPVQTSVHTQYQAHVPTGWQAPGVDGSVVGTVGQNLRLEAFTARLSGALPAGASVCYRANVQKVGWQSSVCDGTVAGTVGKALGLQAFALNLVNMPGHHVCYRARLQAKGWQGSKCDGAIAGAIGQPKPIEALLITVT